MKIIKTGIIILGLGLTGSVLAGPVTWNTTSGSAVCSSGVGNSCSFTNSGYTLTGRAYSTTNNSGTGQFEEATLTRYSGGLGVKNPDQNNENSSPNHALDDSGRDELIVFENNNPGYAFTGFGIGWRQNDSDISTWVGTLAANYDFTGTRFSDLAGLGFTKIDFTNVLVNSPRSLGGAVGNYLILAPRADGNSDYFKVSAISGRIPTQVSEPGILVLFAVTLLGLGASRRRIGY